MIIIIVVMLAIGDAAARIEQLLLGSISSPQEASRLCAAQWANRLFPFQHVPARYISTLAAGDVKLEIREEGQSGLNPPKPQPGLGRPFCSPDLLLWLRSRAV